MNRQDDPRGRIRPMAEEDAAGRGGPVPEAAVPPNGFDPPDTEAGHAYSQLRSEILLGKLPAGVVLVEAEMIERLRIGRTPLREAIRMLSYDGLVEVLPRRGTYVTSVEPGDYVHLLRARRAIEPVIARDAVHYATRAQLADFGRFVARATELASTEELGVGLDTEFHRRILDMSPNRFVKPFYWRLAGESMRMLNAMRIPFEPTARLVPTFTAALKALEERDAGALESCLISHVDSVEDRLTEALRSLPVNVRIVT